MLEFFDYFLIGFVLAFIIQPWHLTFRQSAIILVSSGVGAILGAVIASSFAAFTTDVIGWRGLFLVGTAPAAFTLLVRAWVPKTPHWLVGQGRGQEARKSLAWALKVPAESLPMPDRSAKREVASWLDLLQYPKKLGRVLPGESGGADGPLRDWPMGANVARVATGRHTGLRAASAISASARR